MRRKISSTEEFDPARVKPLPGQPRKRFHGIAELAASIREVGQSTPGIVTLIEDDRKFDAQLIDGERRLRACQKLGVPFRAEVSQGGEDAFAASFAANFGRQEHDAIEIAEALQKLRDQGRSVEQIAAIAGHSDAWVYSHLNMLKLHPQVQEMMIPTESRSAEQTTAITFMIAQMLSRLDHKQQLELARAIEKNDMGLAAARRIVLRRGGGVSSKGRQKQIDTVRKLARSVGDRVGVYLDMQASEFNALVDAVDHRTKRLVCEAIEELIDSLSDLAAAVEKRIPKLKRA